MTNVYTLEDVQKHKGREECWLVIGGKVYDVTQFLEEHPGGDEVLLSATGKDATDDFEDVGHSDGARKLMDKYLIGNIDETTLPEKLDHATDPRLISTTANNNSSEILTKVLQFLIPLAFLALAIAVRFLSNDKGKEGSP